MARKKKGNPSPELPPTRGVPSGECMWLPKHYGAEVRAKGGISSRIRWDLAEVVDFLFPHKYQPKYHSIALEFLSLVLDKDVVGKEDIAVFLSESGYSRSTLENKIIPKLARCGLIKREREASGMMGKKSRALVISASLTYSNYLAKISSEWETLVETARHRRKKKE
ncbi:MAG: hypothetical protein B6U97_03765 [Candidatus Altiarchaeales archaeon ex4484_96]|nr:MAG: hypothetical protein B6U97_03765 [Candidatus Altiarchaeales archaeon ex4484_96]